MQARAISELQKEAREIIESAVLVAPETAAETLAHQVASDRENRAFVAELGFHLACRHLASLIRAERRRAAKSNPRQIPLPGFEHLGRIQKRRGGTVDIRKARFIDLEYHLALLNRQYEQKRKDDRRIAELEKAIALMRPYAQAARGITLLEVLNLIEDSRNREPRG